MMSGYFRSILLLAALVVAASCVFENDMSYPVIPGEILEFEVEGQSSVTIDNDRREVRVVMDEVSDIRDVVVKKLTLTDGAVIQEELPDRLDLSSPLQITLLTYQKYVWTITASQPISRYIEVDDQVGEAEFNLAEKIAIVYVTDNQPLASVTFRDMKLEPEGSSILSTTGQYYENGQIVEETVDCTFPMTLDCVLARTFKVLLDGEEITWSVKVLQKSVEQEIVSVNAWCYHAVVRGTFSGSGNPVLEYRKDTEDAWTAADALVAGVGISADITGLEAAAAYKVRIVNGEAVSDEYSFTTETPVQLPNMSFDDWWQDGKVWYPYLENAAEKVWDSANKATAAFIGSSTTPEDVVAVSGRAVRMESKNAVIAFAAGNIYTGTFGNIAGLGAELDWGTPFTARPSALKGYYNYIPVTIDKVKAPYESMKGQTDKCQIQILLTDWDEPFHINTSAGKFVDFDNDEHIIAYAKLESDEPTYDWKEFEIKLEYRDTERKPKYVVITCCASYLGDYFTGGVGSLLYVDEFGFEYE